MRGGRVRWGLRVSRWGLGAGLLVSFTASAGIDTHMGYSAAFLADAKTLLADKTIPPVSSAWLLSSLPVEARAHNPAFHSLFGRERRLEPEPNMGEPVRADLKSGPRQWPSVERRMKTDLDPDGLDDVAFTLPSAQSWMVMPPREAVTARFSGSASKPLSAHAYLRFQHEPEAGGTSTALASAPMSPEAAAAGMTPAQAEAVTAQTTPLAPERFVIASTTPLQVETQESVAIARAEPSHQNNVARAKKPKPQVTIAAIAPNTLQGLSTLKAEEPVTRAGKGYRDLINSANLSREERCLAEAVYFEARSEPELGQAAVAQVVLNRIKSGLYPTSICGVVYQNSHRHLACEFTFTCEGKSLAVTEPGPWATAVRLARAVLDGSHYNPRIANATHYHANYVSPRWGKHLKKMDVIGRHIFYLAHPTISQVCPGCNMDAFRRIEASGEKPRI
jgi:spore germination cell wall hydrolase CwlJ-like protein